MTCAEAKVTEIKKKNKKKEEASVISYDLVSTADTPKTLPTSPFISLHLQLYRFSSTYLNQNLNFKAIFLRYLQSDPNVRPTIGKRIVPAFILDKKFALLGARFPKKGGLYPPGATIYNF